jgi:aminoacylase
MKCVCMGYVEAILRLKQHQYQPKRTIHLSFMPDEENSGRRGMGEFVKSADFKELNVGFALDEGLANEGNAYTVFNSERCIWWLHVKATGDAGHGSRFVKDTAMEKLITSINKFLAFRKEQQELLECQHLDGCSHAHAAKRKRKLGDVTTVNLTALSGGHSDGDGKWLLNVIPSQASAGMIYYTAIDSFMIISNVLSLLYYYE